MGSGLTVLLLALLVSSEAAEAQGLDPSRSGGSSSSNLGVAYCAAVMPSPDSVFSALPTLGYDDSGNAVQTVGPTQDPAVLQARMSDLLSYAVCLERIAGHAYSLLIEEWAREDCEGRDDACIGERVAALTDSIAASLRTRR